MELLRKANRHSIISFVCRLISLVAFMAVAVTHFGTWVGFLAGIMTLGQIYAEEFQVSANNLRMEYKEKAAQDSGQRTNDSQDGD